METKLIITKKDDQILIHFPSDVVYMNPETLELASELKKIGVFIVGFSTEFDGSRTSVKISEVSNPKEQSIEIEPSRDRCRYSEICNRTECFSCHGFIPK